MKKKSKAIAGNYLEEEVRRATYQACMAYEKGGAYPDDAYAAHRFVKDNSGKWVYVSSNPKNNFVCQKCGIKMSRFYMRQNNICNSCISSTRQAAIKESK